MLVLLLSRCNGKGGKNIRNKKTLQEVSGYVGLDIRSNSKEPQVICIESILLCILQVLKQNYLSLPAVCLVPCITARHDCTAEIDSVQRLKSSHGPESKSWPVGTLGLWVAVAWEAYALLIFSYSLNPPTHTVVQWSVGRTTPDRKVAWTPICEPDVSHFASFWNTQESFELEP